MPISLSRRLVYCLFFIFLLFVCVIRFPSPTSAQSSVVIGEVQWAGSEASSADEWIELWNQGSTPFPLHSFRLRGVGGDADILFRPTDIIEPQSAFLIANYHASDTKSTLAFEAQIVTTTLSINNEDSTILLIDPNGTTVDEASWGRLAPGGTSGSPRRSLLRANTGTSTWRSASSTQNLDTSFVQYGTPGICDSCSMINDSPTTATASPSETLIELDEDMIDPLILENLLPVEQPPSALTQTVLDDLQAMLEVAQAEELLDVPPSVTSTDSQNELLQPLLNITEVTSSSPVLNTQTVLTESIPIIYSEQGTTTDPLSASLPTIDPVAILVEATTTLIIPTTTTTTTTTTTPPPPSVTPLNSETPYVTPPPTPPLVRFNELLAATSKPNEWLEFSTEALSSPAMLYGWSIRDAKHTILTFGPTTVFTWNPETQLLVLTFSKGKLLDKGAEISLVTNTGITVDTISFPAQTKDQSFARITRAGAAWKKTNLLTPGQENLFAAIATAPSNTKNETMPVPVKAKTDTQASTATSASPEKSTVSKPPSPTNTRTIESVSLKNETVKTSSVKSKSTSSSTKKVTTPSKKAAPKKTAVTTSSKTTAPQPVALQDLSSMYVSRRVVLSGTVATLPRLLGNNAFVLQTDDGRGLYVYGNAKQASPPFRARVELTGTISATDDGLALHMYAADRWRILDLDHTVHTRVPDLLSPGNEDSWSYVNLQATVVDAKATKIAVLHNDIHLEISIRPLLQYRPERLQKGDVIEVSGILDTRKDIPVLIPRLAEEIRIIKNAPPKSAATATQSPFPNWIPIGVAGASIAVTQGARRYWYHRQEKQLRHTAKSMNQLPSIKT